MPIAAYRRRRVAGLLVAAAAIVVGGVVVAPHVHVGSGGSSATTAAEDSSAGSERAREHRQLHTPASGLPPQAIQGGTAHLRNGRLVVRPQHFSADALAGRRLLDEKSTSMATGGTSCPAVPQSASTVPAEYQQAPAALVYRHVEGSSQVVDLYICGNPRPVRSTTLPVP